MIPPKDEKWPKAKLSNIALKNIGGLELNVSLALIKLSNLVRNSYSKKCN